MSEDGIFEDWAGYNELTIEFVIIFDDEGNYILHGDSKSNPAEMFKAVSALWNLNPAAEMASHMSVSVKLPSIAKSLKPIIDQ